MPSCITHQLISERAKRNFPQELRGYAEDHPDYFFLGAQGPDLLFFHRVTAGKKKNIGKLLHRRKIYDTFVFFRDELAAAKGTERARIGAYVAGYLTHYAADATFHPYVYRYLAAHPQKGMIHQLIETDWDVFFAGREGGSAEKYSFPFRAKKINREGTLPAFFARLSAFLGLPASERSFRRAVSLFERYLKFFHGRSHARGWEKTEKALRLKPRLSCLYPRATPDERFLRGEEFMRLSGGYGTAEELFSRAAGEGARVAGLFEEALGSGAPLPDDFRNGLLTGERE